MKNYILMSYFLKVALFFSLDGKPGIHMAIAEIDVIDTTASWSPEDDEKEIKEIIDTVLGFFTRRFN